MTKPDWCPQRVWDEAVEHWRADGCSTGSAIGYARAILAAEKREREACARLLETTANTYLPGGIVDVRGGLRIGATAIRNRNGE